MKGFETIVSIRFPSEILALLREAKIPVSVFVRDAVFNQLICLSAKDDKIYNLLRSYWENELSKLQSELKTIELQEKETTLKIDQLNVKLEETRRQKQKVLDEIKNIEENLSKIEEMRKKFREIYDILKEAIKVKFENIVDRLDEIPKEAIEYRVIATAKELKVSEELVKSVLTSIYPEVVEALNSQP